MLKLKCSAFIRNTSFTENWKGRLKNWVFVLSVRILVPSGTGQHTVSLDYLKFLKLKNYIGIGLVGLYRWLAHLKFRNAAGRKPSLLRFLHACIIKRLVRRLNHAIMATTSSSFYILHASIPFSRLWFGTSPQSLASNSWQSPYRLPGMLSLVYHYISYVYPSNSVYPV